MLGTIFKNRRAPSVTIRKEWDRQADAFYTPGVLVRVRGGKGLLKEVYGEADNVTYWSVLMGEMPLMQFQGDEYFCPTCEKIIRSGYGLEPEFHAGMPGLNRSKAQVTLRQAVEELFPLLGLLTDGYYVILDTQLHPTDGNGNFFWDRQPETAAVGSCPYYHGDGEWGHLRPYFTVATQPRELCSRERVEYYREHEGCRAVAYYMDGYLTALLDGHHKAFAAALDHRDVNALVIVAGHMCYSCIPGQKGCEPRYSMGDMNFSCQDLGLSGTDFEMLKKQLSGQNMAERVGNEEMALIRNRFQGVGPLAPLPYDTAGLADRYPTAEEQADIDRVGGVEDEVLDGIIREQIAYNEDEILYLMKAMGALRHPRTVEMADFFSWQGHRPDVYRAIFGAVMRMPRTEALEQFLIDKMVELEQDHPDVGKMILKYL